MALDAKRQWLSYCEVCSGSVVVTAYDFKFGCLGSNPEWGPILYCKALITAQGSTSVPEQLNIKAVTCACELIAWLQPCAVFGHTFSGISWHIPQ